VSSFHYEFETCGDINGCTLSGIHADVAGFRFLSGVFSTQQINL